MLRVCLGRYDNFVVMKGLRRGEEEWDSWAVKKSRQPAPLIFDVTVTAGAVSMVAPPAWLLLVAGAQATPT